MRGQTELSVKAQLQYTSAERTTVLGQQGCKEPGLGPSFEGGMKRNLSDAKLRLLPGRPEGNWTGTTSQTAMTSSGQGAS